MNDAPFMRAFTLIVVAGAFCLILAGINIAVMTIKDYQEMRINNCIEESYNRGE